jgi:hypothetical protein
METELFGHALECLSDGERGLIAKTAPQRLYRSKSLRWLRAVQTKLTPEPSPTPGGPTTSSWLVITSLGAGL